MYLHFKVVQVNSTEQQQQNTLLDTEHICIRGTNIYQGKFFYDGRGLRYKIRFV